MKTADDKKAGRGDTINKENNNRRKVNGKTMPALILGILLIGIASSAVFTTGIIPYFGKIIGTATVNAPTFYFNGGNNSNLNLDSFPSEENYFNLTGNESFALFYAPNLNVSHLYPPEFDIFLRVRTMNNVSEDSTFVNVKVIKFDNGTNHSSMICDANIPVHSGPDFVDREGNCSSKSEIDFNGNETLKFVLRGINDSIKYQFKTGGYNENSARIEVNGA